MLSLEKNNVDYDKLKSNKNKEQSRIFFKTSDYDLDKDERKIEYKDYNIILCGKCNEKFTHGWHCGKCYKNETEEEQHRMLYGKCKGCSQVMKIHFWCSPCNSRRFQKDFDKWTSDNDEINKLIKESQTSAYSNHILEWIPYENFTDLKFIAKGGFSEVYSAIWTNGRIEKWDQGSNNWKRSGSFKVALKVLENSKNLSDDFLNELRFLKKFPNHFYKYITECYGITREPKTLNYALVLKLKDCSLRNYLDNHYNTLTLKDKLGIIERICMGLNCIHSYNIIHKDLHSGNILQSFKTKSDTSISDFGLCGPANEIRSRKTEEIKVYGMVPYIAPEVLRGKEHTQESDIYSLGIIMNEIIFGNRPFNSRPYDEFLALDICKGLRPNIRDKTPKPLEELIRKCWDENPENRPNTQKIYDMLRDFMYTRNEGNEGRPHNYRKYTKQYEENRKSSYDLVNELNVIISPPEEQGKSQGHSVIIVETTKVNTSVYDECTDCAIDLDPNCLGVGPFHEKSLCRL